jgi:hypothetical protein
MAAVSLLCAALAHAASRGEPLIPSDAAFVQLPLESSQQQQPAPTPVSAERLDIWDDSLQEEEDSTLISGSSNGTLVDELTTSTTTLSRDPTGAVPLPERLLQPLRRLAVDVLSNGRRHQYEMEPLETVGSACVLAVGIIGALWAMYALVATTTTTAGLVPPGADQPDAPHGTLPLTQASRKDITEDAFNFI